MMVDSNTDNGNAMATLVAELYIISSRMIYQAKPLPIRSSMYLNKNNISNTNITMKSVLTKGLINDLSSKRWIFFIRAICIYRIKTA